MRAERVEPSDWSGRASKQSCGVTAGKARHKSSNVMGVTTDNVGRKSSNI